MVLKPTFRETFSSYPAYIFYRNAPVTCADVTSDIIALVSHYQHDAIYSNCRKMLQGAVYKPYAVYLQHTFGIVPGQLTKPFTHSGRQYNRLHFESSLKSKLLIYKKKRSQEREAL